MTTDRLAPDLSWPSRMVKSAAERAAAGDVRSAVADAGEAVRRTQAVLHELLTVAREQGVSWNELSGLVRRDADYLAAAYEDYDPDALMAIDPERQARWRPLG